MQTGLYKTCPEEVVTRMFWRWWRTSWEGTLHLAFRRQMWVGKGARSALGRRPGPGKGTEVCLHRALRDPHMPVTAVHPGIPCGAESEALEGCAKKSHSFCRQVGANDCSGAEEEHKESFSLRLWLWGEL